jgi:hypothetical protein
MATTHTPEVHVVPHVGRVELLLAVPCPCEPLQLVGALCARPVGLRPVRRLRSRCSPATLANSPEGPVSRAISEHVRGSQEKRPAAQDTGLSWRRPVLE